MTEIIKDFNGLIKECSVFDKDFKYGAISMREIAIKKVKEIIANEENHGTSRDDIYAQGQIDILEDIFNLSKEDLQ